MARIKKKRFRTPQEKYIEHKRNAKIIFVIAIIALVVYTIMNRQRLKWWIESFM